MRYAYKYIIISLTADALELTTTASGDKFLKSKLASAVGVSDSRYSQARFTKSSLTMLGELLQDIEESRTELISEFLGVLDDDLANEIVNKLWWEGMVKISKGTKEK
jgi:predicted thioredoxin/glutaredoxin